jgi:3-deoxy-D-manno-octulosonic-acid transferase
VLSTARHRGYTLLFADAGFSAGDWVYVLYSLLLAVGFVLSLPYYAWKGRATGKYLATFRERMGRLPEGLRSSGRPAIWVHAVSVGEVIVARPLILALKQRLPGYDLFLSTTTVTGNAIAKSSGTGADGLFFAPFDGARAVRRALERIDPRLLVVVETELWPNLIHESRRRGTRVAVVNGRISTRSYPRYRWIRPFLRRVLAEVDLFLMQGDAHAERVRALGAPPARVQVTGNLKYDALDVAQAGPSLVQVFGGRAGRPLWVAGSTVPGEEAAVLGALRTLRDVAPDLGLVIAPRRPERFGEVLPLVEAAGFRGVRRTALDGAPWSDGDVLVLDTIGELAQVYPMATVVFVGGSLAPYGGHNILEAAIAGKAVVVGPHMENFQEIADTFRAADAFVQVPSAEALADAVGRLFVDTERRNAIGERARSLIERNRGAVARTVDALAALVA